MTRWVSVHGHPVIDIGSLDGVPYKTDRLLVGPAMHPAYLSALDASKVTRSPPERDPGQTDRVGKGPGYEPRASGVDERARPSPVDSDRDGWEPPSPSGNAEYVYWLDDGAAGTHGYYLTRKGYFAKNALVAVATWAAGLAARRWWRRGAE